jgi:hypothetical protein
MEVHHHTHTDPSHSGASRKKFTHYLWEFLMLFLAIFCGFLAENLREHQVEKNRARQYMLSLYEDLKTDTARLNDKHQTQNEKQLWKYMHIHTLNKNG